MRDLTFNAAAHAGRFGPPGVTGPVVCLWPSHDCCGPMWSDPVGGLGMSRWLTVQPTQAPTLCPGWLSRPTGCGINYSTCDGSLLGLREHLDLVQDPGVLEVLRGQLDELIQYADAQRPRVEAEFTPTAAEVEAMEARVQLMHDQVAAHRKRLDERG